MSVLCCQIADFLIKTHHLHHPQTADRPLALLDEADRVRAVSPQACRSGVLPGVHARAARSLCPDLTLAQLDTGAAAEVETDLWRVLSATDLPVERLGWGSAYVDLHTVTSDKERVRPLCVDLGRQLRQRLGTALVPSLGWDSGKFTARVAAVQARSGCLRLVARAEEKSFLRAQPVTLLPLSPEQIQQLHWLGIRTLGAYAALPQVAVWQRFGPAGKLAWQWARGRDDRPVAATAPATGGSALVQDFVPPVDGREPVLNAALSLLAPVLAELRAGFRGLHRLALTLTFADGSSRSETLIFLLPVDEERVLESRLVATLGRMVWPERVEQLSLQVLETSEAPLGQASLFLELDPPGEDELDAVVPPLRRRHGSIFYRGQVIEAAHPAAERRSRLTVLA